MFVHGIFSPSQWTQTTAKCKKGYKRQAKAAFFFVMARKNFEIFAVHVCFNLKLAAKQQHSHCFRAQCLMRGCQLTEVFLVNSERERVLRQRLHKKNNFFRVSFRRCQPTLQAGNRHDLSLLLCSTTSPFAIMTGEQDRLLIVMIEMK